MTKPSILILDRGNVELMVPNDWVPTPQPGGSLKLTDPTDNAALEISYLTTPGLAVLPPPPLEEFLEQVMEKSSDANERGPIRTERRGPMQFAWCTWPYETMDLDRGQKRRAFQRTLLAQRENFVALLTAYWWADDASWALPVVETACRTLALGDGRQLSSPAEHWSMKKRD